MALNVTCPNCEKTYQVQEEAGGKKIRCKGCRELIPIPAPKTEDHEDDWDDLIEDVPAPLPPRSRKPKKKATVSKRAVRRRPARNIPSSVVGSCALCVLGSALWFTMWRLTPRAMQGPDVLMGNIQHAKWSTIIPLVWGTLDVIILLGLLFRFRAARPLGIAIDVLGVLGALAMAGLVVFSVIYLMSNLQPNQYIRWGAVVTRLVGFAIVGLVWFLDIQLLRNPDTAEYLSDD
jgi:hypothetical protein